MRHRDALAFGKITLAEVAAREKLNAQYLASLWQTLTDKTESYPLDAIRAKWRIATEKDVPALTAEVTAWQMALWKFAAIGSYRATYRQLPNDPGAVELQTIHTGMKPPPGQSEVTLYLTTAFRDAAAGRQKGMWVWVRVQRFEMRGKPVLLLPRLRARFGGAFEGSITRHCFGPTAPKYLAAAVELANDKKLTADELAKKYALDAAFLKRWGEVLAVEPFARDAESIGRLGASGASGAHAAAKRDAEKRRRGPRSNGWHKKRAPTCRFS